MADCVQNCPVSARVDALKDEFDRYRENSTATHDKMFNRIGALEQNRAAIAEKLDGMDEKLDGITEKVGALTDKPAKRWETVIAAAISAVVAGVVAYLLAGGKIG